MQQVGFDDQIFLAQHHGGISRYVVELLSAFAAHPDLGVEVVPGWSRAPNRHAREAGLVPAGRTRSFEPGGWRTRAYFAANLRARARARRAPVLHQTFYHPRWLAAPPGVRRVVTVHDMTPELMPEMFDHNPHLEKEVFVREADLLLCISENTRRDLLAVYGDLAAPIVVTPLGVDGGFSPRGPVPADLQEGFVLYVGSRVGYKDFATLAEAVATSETRHLLAVGGGPFSEDEEAMLVRIGIRDRVQQRTVSDEALPGIYRRAGALAFPSRYEGFGLPALEAMASGCPVVLADSSSLPEVGGDAALYFPPGDSPALGQALDRLAGDAALRARLVGAGLQRAAEFTWEATARATAAAYRLLT